MESRESTLLIRKLRKKLRQIEHLESLERDLTDEELSKCMKKDIVRDQLLQQLANSNQNSSTSNPSNIDIDPNSSFSVSTDLSTSISVSETDINVQIGQTESKCGDTVWGTDDGIKLQEEERQDSTSVKGKDTAGSPAPEKQKADRSKDAGQSDPKPSASSSTEFKQPQPSPVKKSKKTTKDSASVKNSVTDQWRSSCFEVTALDSHSDLVTAVDCCGSLLVSASRDTTVKIWDMASLTELRSLGSHTGSVTDVVIIPGKLVPAVGECLGIAEDDHLVFSGSVDCSIKVWSAKTGELLRSVYTYNPITKLAFSRALSQIVTASDGGKLEVWDIESKESIVSEKAHDDSITGLCVWVGPNIAELRALGLGQNVSNSNIGTWEFVERTTSMDLKGFQWNYIQMINMKSRWLVQVLHSYVPLDLVITRVEDKKICTSCANDGEIKVFEVRDQALHCIYASENIRNLSGATMAMRHIRALNVKGDNLFYGDDGVNVKILSWKKGIVKKLPNHKEEFGMTDAICFHDNLMFTSAYDLDTGQGYVNVFDATYEPSYITSVLCEDTRRILDICCAESDDRGTTFVTAGLDLLVWKKVLVTRNNAKDLIPTKFIQELSKFAQDSDLESEVEFTESEDEGVEGRRSRRGSHQSQGKGGWGSWCSLV